MLDKSGTGVSVLKAVSKEEMVLRILLASPLLCALWESQRGAPTMDAFPCVCYQPSHGCGYIRPLSFYLTAT